MSHNASGTYLNAASAALDLLADRAVAERWEEPSALAEFAVSGLAAHLARQIIMVPAILTGEPPEGAELVTVLEHYARAAWVDAALDDEVNVSMRRTAEADAQAAGGAAGLVQRTRAAFEQLTVALPGENPDRVCYLSWTGWALTLSDFLLTRTLEIVIHVDDLAVSVGVEPVMDAGAEEVVLVLLARLSARRHGTAAVLRALSRRERAPKTIAAF
jgi:uncharacterized protein (TIGR03083 family)